MQSNRPMDLEGGNPFLAIKDVINHQNEWRQLFSRKQQQTDAFRWQQIVRVESYAIATSHVLCADMGAKKRRSE